MWLFPIPIANSLRTEPEHNAFHTRDVSSMFDDEDGDDFSWFQGIGWIMRVGSKGKILRVGG